MQHNASTVKHLLKCWAWRSRVNQSGWHLMRSYYHIKSMLTASLGGSSMAKSVCQRSQAAGQRVQSILFTKRNYAMLVCINSWIRLHIFHIFSLFSCWSAFRRRSHFRLGSLPTPGLKLILRLITEQLAHLNCSQFIVLSLTRRRTLNSINKSSIRSEHLWIVSKTHIHRRTHTLGQTVRDSSVVAALFALICG